MGDTLAFRYVIRSVDEACQLIPRLLRPLERLSLRILTPTVVLHGGGSASGVGTSWRDIEELSAQARLDSVGFLLSHPMFCMHVAYVSAVFLDDCFHLEVIPHHSDNVLPMNRRECEAFRLAALVAADLGAEFERDILTARLFEEQRCEGLPWVEPAEGGCIPVVVRDPLRAWGFADTWERWPGLLTLEEAVDSIKVFSSSDLADVVLDTGAELLRFRHNLVNGLSLSISEFEIEEVALDSLQMDLRRRLWASGVGSVDAIRYAIGEPELRLGSAAVSERERTETGIGNVVDQLVYPAVGERCAAIARVYDDGMVHLDFGEWI